MGISLAWAVPNAREGVGVALIGTRTRVRGAPLRWEQGSSGFDGRGAMAVEAWGLTAAAGSEPRRQSLILRIPTDRLSELIVPGASFETTAWFRVVRFGPPTVFERPARGSARIGDGFFHLLEWKEKTPNGLGIRFFWLAQGSDDLPAVVLVGPEGREWARRGGEWADGDTLLFERSDGTVRAIDLKKREGFGRSAYGSDTREATEEERSRAFSANG